MIGEEIEPGRRVDADVAYLGLFSRDKAGTREWFLARRITPASQAKLRPTEAQTDIATAKDRFQLWTLVSADSPRSRC